VSITLRPYVAADEGAAIALWQRTWQVAYPQIAFGKRLEWWRARWRDDLVPVATIVIAERDGAMIGFVTIDQKTGYLDQLVVAPEFWRSGIGRILVDEAKRLSPEKLELHVNQDNERAIALYVKTGFSITGESVSKHSGFPLYVMTWRPR
jgi:putative acetyltransferase